MVLKHSDKVYKIMFVKKKNIPAEDFTWKKSFIGNGQKKFLHKLKIPPPRPTPSLF